MLMLPVIVIISNTLQRPVIIITTVNTSDHLNNTYFIESQCDDPLLTTC